MRALPDSHSVTGVFAGFERHGATGTLLIAPLDDKNGGATRRFPIASLALIGEIARLAYHETIRLVFVSDGLNRRMMRPSYIERGIRG